MRKFKENPLIPIGGLVTIGFLTNGLFKFGRKDSAGSQVMMRGRIVAQGFTVVALMSGRVSNGFFGTFRNRLEDFSNQLNFQLIQSTI